MQIFKNDKISIFLQNVLKISKEIIKILRRNNRKSQHKNFEVIVRNL